jgi:hypothetical protein
MKGIVAGASHHTFEKPLNGFAPRRADGRGLLRALGIWEDFILVPKKGRFIASGLQTRKPASRGVPDFEDRRLFTATLLGALRRGYRVFSMPPLSVSGLISVSHVLRTVPSWVYHTFLDQPQRAVALSRQL